MVYTFTSHADFRTQPSRIRESISCGFHLSAEVKCEIENMSQGLLGKCFPSGRRFSVESSLFVGYCPSEFSAQRIMVNDTTRP